MTFSLRAAAASAFVVVVAGIVVFTVGAGMGRGEGSRGCVWLGGVCALNLAPNIKINNVCMCALE